METGVTAREVPVTADGPEATATLLASRAAASCVAGGKTPLATLTCVICRAEFTANRKSAKCCSGKCRLALSRRTRVADVAARLAKAEAALHEATVALGELRALVEVGVGKAGTP